MKPSPKTGDVLKIRISRLSEGLHEYHFSANPTEIGLEENFRSNVEVDVRIDKTQRQLYLQSDIRTAGVFQCDRCLDEFTHQLSAHFNMMYVHDELDTRRYPADEVQVIAPDTVTIDISEDVRQVVALAVPLKLLCKEDCKGLCPRCGVNRNRELCTCSSENDDPRWAKLKGVINN